MSNSKLHLLFPTAVEVVDNIDIPVEDHDQLLATAYNASYNTGQFNTTKNNYILDTHAPTLRNWIQSRIDNYTKNVMATSSKLKITQSWCLMHKNVVQQLFIHAHPNSIISGAYYVMAPEGSQGIRFHSKSGGHSTPFIDWETDSTCIDQPWTADWNELSVKTGRLILFPSQTYHSVDGQEVNPNVRCVLSFNTWFEGGFGDPSRLQELK